jgi:glycerate kinase
LLTLVRIPFVPTPTSERPRVLVAPDSFKGTFSAPEVADAIARGIERSGLIADRCPVADGGEGTLDAIVAASGGRVVSATARPRSWIRPPRAASRC